MKHSPLLLTLLLAAGLYGAPTPGGIRIATGPYLQAPSETSMTVMWLTDRNATGYVEYGEPGAAPRRAVSSHHGLIDANERIHRVTLSGLKPGAAYRYRVVSRDILNFGPYKVDFGQTAASGEHEFRTLDRSRRELSFLVFNDIHQVASVLPEMLRVAGPEPYDFVVLNGDVLSDIEEESQITGILNSAVELFASRVPMLWVRGNHETRGKFARMLPDYLALPGGSFYYSFDHGPAHFTVLDTGEDKEDSNAAYSGLVDFFGYRRQEREWLSKEVRSSTYRSARFRIGIAHVPFPEEPGKWEGVADAHRNFTDLLNASPVDLLLSAHKHQAAVVEPREGRNPYPIVRGGGQTPANRTVIRVNVTPDRVTATILRPGGEVAGRREVRRR